MRVLLFVALCSAALAATPTSLSKLPQGEVLELLRHWRLDKAFSHHFQQLGFDGAALDVLDENEELDSNLFPDTSSLHWKILLRKVAEYKKELKGDSKRRSLKAVDTSGFKGIRVKNDNAIVALGKKQDVRLVRTGDKKLTIFADVEIKGNMKYSGGGGSGDVRVGNSATKCTAANAGAMRWVPKKGLTVCDGKMFHYVKSIGGEWLTAAGTVFSQFSAGKGESFARDDVNYCLNCANPNSLGKSGTDFRIGSGMPFNYFGGCGSNTCEISGDAHGNIHLAGTNGNDAIRMQKALLKGDFEYGCTTTKGTSTHTRFGMGLWGVNAVSQFKSGNSAGYCAQAKSGNCYFCRFEGGTCAYRGSYSKVFGLNNIHDENVEFKFVRKGGQICGYTKGVKRGCYSQKYTGDMYAAVQNDGGASRNLHKCFYRSLGKKTPAKGNFQFAALKARNSDKTMMSSYTVVSGKMPPGMKLDKKSGMIYGNPTDVSKAKKFSFAVQASGKEGTALKRGFTIEVRHRQSVDKRSTDFSQGSNKAFKFVGSCNGKCEIASDAAGNIKLSGSNGNDAIIMNKPLLVGDFEYGCTTTSGTSSTTRFGMGLWDKVAFSHFRSSNSNGNCASTKHGTCYFCRFEASRCAFRGTQDATFGLSGIHSANARFMFKRVNGQICGYINDKKKGCFTQKTTRSLYGAIQNDGGASRNMHKCYYKTSSNKISYK